MHVEIELLLKTTKEGVRIDRVAIEDYISDKQGYDDSTNGIFCEDGSMILMCARNFPEISTVYSLGWHVAKAVGDVEWVQDYVKVFEVRGKVVSA